MKNAIWVWVLHQYFRHELPGWGRAYTWLVGDYRDDAKWAGLPPQTVRGKFHGYEMTLNLEKWSERFTFFLERYYDLPSQLLLKAVLTRGDRMLDIGANIGMMSLVGASQVGTSGRVDACEPNPECAAKIKGFLSKNRIEQVVVHPSAVGEDAGSATLTIPEWNSGEATLTALHTNGDRAVTQIAVPVATGDAIVALDPRGPVLIKIDVEGWEVSVLRSLRHTLQNYRPVVLTEVVESHLARAGHSTSILFDFMESMGYEAHTMGIQRQGLGHVLTLSKCGRQAHGLDVAWIHPESTTRPRLAQIVR